jgi:hypothetical protein
VVAVEYFTKWIEAKPLVNIAIAGLKSLYWQKYNMLFWSAQKDDSRQCKVIRLSHIQGFLPSDGGRSSLCVRVPPSMERSSEKDELIDIHRHKEDTRGSAESQMGRRIAKSSMEP